jgi:peptidoglycan-N-acetylglucosamine deacetylase
MHFKGSHLSARSLHRHSTGWQQLWAYAVLGTSVGLIIALSSILFTQPQLEPIPVPPVIAPNVVLPPPPALERDPTSTRPSPLPSPTTQRTTQLQTPQPTPTVKFEDVTPATPPTPAIPDSSSSSSASFNSHSIFKVAKSLVAKLQPPSDLFGNDASDSDTAPDQRLVFAPPPRFQRQVVKQVSLSTPDKIIALTFDDGPWGKTTEQVLDILKKEDIKATFFWIGKHLQRYPQIARRVIAEGHVVGNHTWSHRYSDMDRTTAAHEIDDTTALIEQTTGAKTLLFRPPGGRLKNGLAEYAETLDDSVILWSVPSADTLPNTSIQTLINNVLDRATSGGIVLLHDGGGDRRKTVAALPIIVAKLKEQGYQFVTIPELLQKSDQEQQLAEDDLANGNRLLVVDHNLHSN